MPKDYFVLGIRAICWGTMLITAALVIPTLGSQLVKNTTPSPTSVEIPVWDNSTSYIAWYSANITAVENTTIQHNDVYYVVAGGGGGGARGVPTENVTPDPTTNQTLLDLEKQIMQLNDVSMTIIKVVPFLLAAGVILWVLNQLGYIPTFSSRERENVDTSAGTQTVRQIDGTMRPSEAPAAQEREEEKKPEKRDRYEVIKV